MGEPISDNAVEQSTKADRSRVSRPLRKMQTRINHCADKANPAPRDGGLVPPFYIPIK